MSIIGLFIVQYQYLNIGLNLAKVQFRQKVERFSSMIKEDFKDKNQLSFLIVQTFSNDDYFTLGKDSLQVASRNFLNDFLKDRLLKNKIDQQFTYRLYGLNNSFELKSAAQFSDVDSVVMFPIPLEGYLSDSLNEDVFLEIQFVDLNIYFLSQLNGLFLPGLVFLVGIIFIVVWILKLFYWQNNLISITNNSINNLTHELRTPVFSIGLATKILEAHVDDAQKDNLLLIRNQLDRLNKNIDQVLDLAYFENNKDSINYQVRDIRHHLIRCCNNFISLSKLENFEFNYSIDDGSFNVKCSDIHFENAIYNLLDNARKYAITPVISLEAKLIRNSLTISIKDNGRGISDKDKKHVFKKYYRVHDGDKHNVSGYGLGLSYVREVIKVLNGRIRVESKLGYGTTVIIRIPLNHEKS